LIASQLPNEKPKQKLSEDALNMRGQVAAFGINIPTMLDELREKHIGPSSLELRDSLIEIVSKPA